MGGTKKPEKGHLETGLLRVGGEVPESKIHATNLKIAEFKTVEGVKFNIPARQSKEIDIDVIEGKELHWIFTASSEIDFEIISKNGKQVSELVNFKNSYCIGFVRKGKSYKARFDNSFSRFFSKDIEFKYVIKDSQ
uniref:Uncharacterized protein n=1 Tax=Ditylenchus dipsaci TaxID=166011 RepID=A0A915DB56_9BILA